MVWGSGIFASDAGASVGKRKEAEEGRLRRHARQSSAHVAGLLLWRWCRTAVHPRLAAIRRSAAASVARPARMSTLLSPSSRSRPTSPIKPPSPLKPPAAHASPRGGSQHPRQSSGVYSTFSTKQIQGFKEAFNMLDEDSNGLISRNDLRATLRNLGGEDSEAIVKRYFDSAIGGQQSGINFTQFLTMFGEHLNEVRIALV